MRKVNLYLLVTGAALGLSTAQAGGLQGLEMDVMDAEETAAQATARIALPGPGNVVDEGSPGAVSLVTEPAHVGGGQGSEAAAMDYGTDAAPTSPESADDSVSGIDIGEPGGIDNGGGFDSGGLDDGGIVGEEPGDPGVIEPEPGEEPVEDPDNGTPIGDGIDGGPGDGDMVTIPPEGTMPPVDGGGPESQ